MKTNNCIWCANYVGVPVNSRSALFTSRPGFENRCIARRLLKAFDQMSEDCSDVRGDKRLCPYFELAEFLRPSQVSEDVKSEQPQYDSPQFTDERDY